jgi:hypothetical protein
MPQALLFQCGKAPAALWKRVSTLPHRVLKSACVVHTPPHLIAMAKRAGTSFNRFLTSTIGCIFRDRRLPHVARNHESFGCYVLTLSPLSPTGSKRVIPLFDFLRTRFAFNTLHLPQRGYPQFSSHDEYDDLN